MPKRRSHPSHPHRRKPFPVRAAALVIGATGLAALAMAVAGPRRFRVAALAPVSDAVSDQAERLWQESRPLRVQLGRLIQEATSEGGREKLVRSLQSWVGHFKAT